jgi:mannitol-specific phosphotransferase system IIBC component
MKKSDIAMIILIASISVLIAYFVGKAVIGDVQNESVKVKTAEPITSEVSEPDKTIFNTNAINPTVEVIIGGGDDKPADNQP